MDTLTLELPAMYADHHVTEVRGLLLALPGVKSIYASSGFQVLEVTYDPAQLKQADIESALEEAGYLRELALPIEQGVAANVESEQAPFFRHTTAFEQTKNVVGFAQDLPNSGPPLWPCPGMGVIQTMAEEE